MATKESPSEDAIAKSAALLFASQGYHGTNTRDIAHLAEVSENTLFRHFESKKNLFWCSLRYGMEAVKSQLDSPEGRECGDPPKIALPRITNFVVETIKSSPEVFRLMAIASIELGADIEGLCCEVFSTVLEELSKCLAETGRNESAAIMRVDPSLLAASLAIALLHPKMSNFPAGNKPPSDDFPAGVQRYSKFWLDLLTRPSNVERLESFAEARR